MRLETKESAEYKIKELRTGVATDKTEKMAKPKRKAGEAEAQSGPEEGDGGKAGGTTYQRVRFWDVPEEFEAVDYTKPEDVQELVKAPEQDWAVPASHQERAYHGGEDDAPSDAVALMNEAKHLQEGPVLQALAEASNDLYAWAATRVAREPALTLEELLEEMQMYGASDLAHEAAALMERQPEGGKAGEQPRLTVRDTMWAHGEPGQGSVEVDGVVWRTWDYLEDVTMNDELASVLGVADPGEEKRQCVTKTMAAGILWRRLGRRPTMAEVVEEARELRLEQTQIAVDANTQMGQAAEFVTPVEHELRIYAHDVVHPHHERDFRSFAVFPVGALEDARVVVLGADVRGRLLVESIVGGSWKPGQWTICALIWKGHMVLAQPPEDFDLETWLEAEDVISTPILGFSFFWHARHDQDQAALHVATAGRDEKQGMSWWSLDDNSQLAAEETVAGTWEARDSVQIRNSAGGDLMLRELFAGQATLTRAWKQRGGKALEPVEVYAYPHHREGYRAAHDLLRPEVQDVHLQRTRHGPENVGWAASPCTSYCDWNLENGGSRTFEHPEGGRGRPLTEKEKEGNQLSEFGAKYFLNMLENDGFPIAESSGGSGRYPKQWDLLCWQAILARPDVDWVEFKMCAYGLGPPDEPDAYYQHLTRVVFRKHAAFKAALSRRCPGVSPTHRHVALKGSRPGSRVTRCTEAGVYCEQFVNVVSEVLQSTLVLGGVVIFHFPKACRQMTRQVAVMRMKRRSQTIRGGASLRKRGSEMVVTVKKTKKRREHHRSQNGTLTQGLVSPSAGLNVWETLGSF